MLRGVFVTGTDTGVGKTVVSAALMHRYRGSGSETPAARLRYWKPVQTGIEQDDDTLTVRRLGGCGADAVLAEGVRLGHPVSPHLAARLAGRSIDVAALVGIAAAQPVSDGWIVEGAGGVLVPLNTSQYVIDVMVALGLPALVVARSAIGTINHTLLTLEALRARAVVVAGVVMVGASSPGNREAIESFGRVDVLGELPLLDPLTPGTLARWTTAGLDRDGRLGDFFQ